jgi:hypothetical protein
MKPCVVLCSIAIALPLVVLAHGKEEHIRGVLKSKDVSALVVTTSTGEARVEADANTRFEAAGKPATADDAHPGQRVVVHASKHDGTLRATRVQLGAMESEPQKGQKP